MGPPSIWARSIRHGPAESLCPSADFDRSVGRGEFCVVLAFDGLFPAILKPAYRPELNRFTLAKAWLAEDARALADRYDEACANIDPSLVMIQERIPGGGECQFSFAALCRDGRPLGRPLTLVPDGAVITEVIA